MQLRIDLETYSGVDLAAGGVYPYTEDPKFRILLFGYALDDEPVKVLDLEHGQYPEDDPVLMQYLFSSNVVKSAFNASFEIACLSKYFQRSVDPNQWICTMIHAWYAGYAGNLALVGKTMGLPIQKDSAGQALIRYFSTPDEKGHRRLPESAPEKWAAFIEYNRRDVEVEREVSKGLATVPLPTSERRLWALDQTINARGIAVDWDFVENANHAIETEVKRLTAESKKFSNGRIENSNSPAQLKQLILESEGIAVQSLDKEHLPAVLAQISDPGIRGILTVRKELGKTSVSKYKALLRARCADGRVRGLLQFYAGHTGRWGGRLIQPHNLPRDKPPALADLREIVKQGRGTFIGTLGPILDLYSQMMRSTLIPTKGNQFLVFDFSAIEARVLAWWAGEGWKLSVFQTHGKIYEAVGAQMYGVPISAVTKDSEYRQKGKTAELGLGYQGGPAALIKMGALRTGLREEELPSIVRAWRKSSPRTVSLWYEMQRAAVAVTTGEIATATVRDRVHVFRDASRLYIQLPSGRRLCYLSPTLDNAGELTFLGPIKSGMGIQHTYGGKLVENVVQAIARDCLAEKLVRLESSGFPVVLHVHDEVVIDTADVEKGLKEVERIMAEDIAWAPGLPLKAAGFSCTFYQKD
jgi:DNA polymerase